MDPSMFVAYTPQTNGVPLESKLATYMVSYFLQLILYLLPNTFSYTLIFNLKLLLVVFADNYLRVLFKNNLYYYSFLSRYHMFFFLSQFCLT